MKLNNNDDSHNSGLNLLIYNMLLDIGHTLRGCVDWNHLVQVIPMILFVTPYVGVWIETIYEDDSIRSQEVTPYVGVWIETIITCCFIITMQSHTLRGCVDWNITNIFNFRYRCVTPYVGVWIETMNTETLIKIREVTPYVGVWIETHDTVHCPEHHRSHPTWVCGLKLWMVLRTILNRSHTLRGCVDWNSGKESGISGSYCHTLRGCVDWNSLTTLKVDKPNSHTLRGCVDWNCLYLGLLEPCIVTPYVGVWIETLPPYSGVTWERVTPYVGVWIETRVIKENGKVYIVTPYVGVWIETR